MVGLAISLFFFSSFVCFFLFYWKFVFFALVLETVFIDFFEKRARVKQNNCAHCAKFRQLMGQP